MDSGRLVAPGPDDGADGPRRLGRAERRSALLDAAAALAAEGSPEAITMEAVAERAGVSRPLVYRHFTNRDELVAAVFQRETTHLHQRLTAEVTAADSLVGMFRALVHGALLAAAERGHLFATLRSAGAWSPEVRREQRTRDAATARAFAERARRELGADGPAAAATTALLLSLVDAVLARWRLDPTLEHAALLEESYMTIVSASLAALAGGAVGRDSTAS
jgi:AcrR family transcriptional regulator